MAAVHFDSTIGAAFVGFAIAAVLYGVLCAQLYTYFQRYSLDRPIYRFMVIAVWLLETLHSVFSGHAVYYYTISSFGNPLALLVPTWSIIGQVLIGACISVLVKSTFAMRVWRFSNNNVILTGCIMIFNVGILVLSVLFTVRASGFATFAEQPKLKWVTTALLTTSVLADLIIAASLTYFLHHLRNTYSANTMVNGLIAYSIETGVITSVCGVATLVVFDTLPTTFIYLSFFFVLSKLYSNSLLATLNTRRSVRGRGTDRSPATNGDFSIVHSPGQVQTTHSIFGQVDWSKQSTDIEVNVLQKVVTTPSGKEMKRTRNVEDSPYSSTYSHSPSWPAVQDLSYRDQLDYGHNLSDRFNLRAPEPVARF